MPAATQNDDHGSPKKRTNLLHPWPKARAGNVFYATTYWAPHSRERGRFMSVHPVRRCVRKHAVNTTPPKYMRESDAIQLRCVKRVVSCGGPRTGRQSAFRDAASSDGMASGGKFNRGG